MPLSLQLRYSRSSLVSSLSKCLNWDVSILGFFELGESPIESTVRVVSMIQELKFFSTETENTKV